MTGRREAPHRAFTLAGRLVRVFGTVVQPVVAAMIDTRHDLVVRRRIPPELIRDQHTRHVCAAVEQRAEERRRGGFTQRVPAAALNKAVQHAARLVDGAPQGVGFPIDCEEALVEVPCIARRARRRRNVFASVCPHVRHHCRTVSSVTITPRSASNSSTSR